MRRVALLLLVSVGWLLASAPPSEAAFVPGFTGNSGLSATPGNAGGWINFAVYDNSGGGDWRANLGLTPSISFGSPAPSGAERAVFFYQVVRDSSGLDASLSTFNVPYLAVPFTTAGWLPEVTFDDGGAVGPVGNTTLGSAAGAGGTVTGVVLPSDATAFTADPAARQNTSAGVNTAPTLEWAEFQWSLTPGFGLFPTDFSNVVFATADVDVNNLQWVLAGTGYGGVAGPTALVPTTTPEPGSLVLLGLAMVVGGAGYGWKRRKQKVAQQQ